MNSQNFSASYDLVVVGGGPAGMAAACAAQRCGVSSVLILERRGFLGGILPQCIHDGFGLTLYQQVLTGPEYAEKWIAKTRALSIAAATDTTVLNISPRQTDFCGGPSRTITCLNPQYGLHRIRANAVILATGCREKTLAQLHIPGTRPAGIYTAGCVQYMMNIGNYLPGRSAVILGFGDIGLIMARRMRLEGINVKMIVGLHATGLRRNIVQCVEDFDIPTRFGWSVRSVHGRERLKGVTIAPVDGEGNFLEDHKEYLPCDTLLVAVGLIPELEVLRDSQLLENNVKTLSPDQTMCIGHAGIFACGNVVKTHDLVDTVTYEGEKAGVFAANWLLGTTASPADLPLPPPGENKEPRGRQGNGAEDPHRSERAITCILCPSSCELTVHPRVKKPVCASQLQVYGGTDGSHGAHPCEKGIHYAAEEYLAPQRTVTGVVRIIGAARPLLPVRTNRPVLKSAVNDVMKRIKKYRCTASIHVGAVLITNIAASGADLIATATAEAAKEEEI